MDKSKPGSKPTPARPAALAQIPLAVAAAAHEPTLCVDAEPYALRVIGHALAPQLPDGCVVIVEPVTQARSGQYVVADLERGVTLGVLRGEPGQLYLHPEGIGRPGLALEAQQIRGVVVQRAGRRRRDHLRFP